ncbi:hypothetical protein BLFGPEAP_02761 [Candidatus Methanoperedenaceae archaeon GB50]|nr:hypothetical protein BLFGPEAP_02761 [Candidatus Methanoperedenaceae archaeon GB50]
MKSRKVNVYVFGAGASVHLEAPVTKDFVYKGFSLYRDAKKHGIYEIKDDRPFRLTAQLIDRLYGTNLEKLINDPLPDNYLTSINYLSSINIEELLSFVDLGRRGGEKWLPFKEFQRALYEFIFTTLEQSTIWKRAGSGADRRRNCYDKLIDYVMPIDEVNCMISFNYDLFLDKAAVINNHRIVGNYHLPFKHIENFPSYEDRLTHGWKEKDIHLLKLHGSLNWGYCPHCKKVSLAFYRRYKSIFKKRCPECKNQLEPILVPPTYFKDFPEPLANVWKVAEDYLKRADRLIIIGYSFPDIDIEAKWLFKRAICKNTNKPSLTIVNPDQNIKEKIVNFFGNFINQNVTWCKKFQKYIEPYKP